MEWWQVEGDYKLNFINSCESAFFFGTQAQGSWAEWLWFGGLGLVHRS